MKSRNSHILIEVLTITILVIFSACSIKRNTVREHAIKSLVKDTARISVFRPNKKVKRDTTKTEPSVIKIKDKDGKEQTIMQADLDDKSGEYMTTVEMQGVEIVARNRQLAERNGTVNIDFVLSVPKKLLDNNWQVALTPHLTKSGDDSKLNLEPCIFTGKEFKLKQQRGLRRYTDYENSIVSDTVNFLENFTNYRLYRITLQRQMEMNKKRHSSLNGKDSLYWTDFFTRHSEIARSFWMKSKLSKLYDRYIPFDMSNNAKIDSIVNGKDDIKYYYSQPVVVDKNSKKMFLVIDGKVQSWSGRKYNVPPTDTITYFVSSMVQFADMRPHFKRQIISRKAVANTYANIQFEVGKNTFREDFADNTAQLKNIQSIIEKLDVSNEFVLDSITVIASSSPEGKLKDNSILSHKRGLALKKYFDARQNEDKDLKSFIKTRILAENWELLTKKIVESDELEHKNEILDLISKIKEQDKREDLIRKNYPRDYTYIRENMYPSLRNTKFAFNMHRKGMLKDTIQTDAPDTLYANAVSMMQDRKYKQALEILLDYDDRNTAICYMSMGYNEQALNIMERLNEEQPESSDNIYLTAILFYRQGKEDKAVEYYLKAVDLDDSKAFRGELDPEINALIKKYNLNKNM